MKKKRKRLKGSKQQKPGPRQIPKQTEANKESKDTVASSGGGKTTTLIWNYTIRLVQAVAVLVGIVAVIQLLPALEVSSETPPANGSGLPFFSVKNVTYTPLTNVDCELFVWKGMKNGREVMHDNLYQNVQDMHLQRRLLRNETFTIDPWYYINSKQVDKLDVCVAVNYEPWPFIFFSSRKIFRFVGTFDGQKMDWYKQASFEIEGPFKVADKNARAFLKTIGR